VLHLRDGAGLAGKALPYLFVFPQVPMDNLDRDLTPQALVASAVHGGHATVTDLLEQLVLVELGK
jgi:hypothetical protein